MYFFKQLTYLHTFTFFHFLYRKKAATEIRTIQPVVPPMAIHVILLDPTVLATIGRMVVLTSGKIVDVKFFPT